MKSILTTLLIALSLSVAGQLTAGLSAYYKFEETSGTDVFSEVNDAILNSTTGSTTKNQTGKIGNCFSYAVGDDYIVSSDVPLLQIGTSDCAVSVWINPTTLTNSEGGWGLPIIGGPSGAMVFYVQSTTGKLSFGSSAVSTIVSNLVVSINEWQHVTASYDQTANEVTLSLDGVTEVIPFSETFTTGSYVIGQSTISTSNEFVGKIDELGVWKRALTAAELITLYNNGDGLAYPFKAKTSLYEPVAGRHVRFKKGGIELKDKPDSLGFYYWNIKGTPADDGDIRIVFAETFDDLATGGITSGIADNWNLVKHTWEDAKLNFVEETGRGKVFKIDFTANTIGLPITNTKIMLDSLYVDLYFQFDMYAEPLFDFGTGGKTFAAFSGGPSTQSPYRGDTVNYGWNTRVLFRNEGSSTARLQWYNHTHDATGYGTTLNETTIQMPSSSKTGTWLFGKDFAWSNPYSVSAPNVGTWYSYPNLTEWTGTVWQPINPQPVLGTITAGEWSTYTVHLRLNENGGYGDIFEYFQDGVCMFTKSDNRYRTIANKYWLIEALDLAAFFGGVSPKDDSPKDQYWKIDNIVVYYYKSNHPDYHSSAMTVGDSIKTIDITEPKYLTTTARAVSETYTEATGDIYPYNNKAFHFVGIENSSLVTPSATKMIKVLNATNYEVTVDYYRGRGNSYYQSWVKIYSYSGGTPTLERSFTTDAVTTPTVITMNGVDSVKIDYSVGLGWGDQWQASYTTNGISVGTNPIYLPPQDMIVPKP